MNKTTKILAFTTWLTIITLSIIFNPANINQMAEYGAGYALGTAFGELLLIFGFFWIGEKLYFRVKQQSG